MVIDNDLKRYKVLVVDDEQDARTMLEHLLHQFNADVRTGDSVDAALAEIHRFAPDLIVSDIGMPGADGYELIRRVRMLGGGRGNTRAIALTAFSGLDDRTRALLAGFQMQLAKPIEPSELIVAIASLTGRVRHDASQ